MNTFEPGRIYRIKVNGIRMVCIQPLAMPDQVYTVNGYIDHSEITDVRGPLIVLDLDPVYPCHAEKGDPSRVVSYLRNANSATALAIADQIEEQTRPPLQIGWHEVKGSPMPRRWDGRAWHIPTGEEDLLQDYTSTHYIGPGSQS